jgi:pimeloyl-ACP methyl ester carboxylesterase
MELLLMGTTSSSIGASNSTTTRSTAEYRRIARQPFGTVLLDQMRLLSPWSWYGASIARGVSWRWKQFVVQSLIVGFLLPVGLYLGGMSTCCSASMGDWSSLHDHGHRFRDSPGLLFSRDMVGCLRCCWVREPVVFTGTSAVFPRWLMTIIIPCWSLVWIWNGTSGIRNVALALFQMLGISGKQATTTRDAWALLAERVLAGRAYRMRRCDVYLPHPQQVMLLDANDHRKQQQKQEAILFFPGFGVDQVAYAAPAALLSDAGYVCVVVSAEPLRAPLHHLGCDAPSIRRIQAAVAANMGMKTQLLRWSLVGHSMGAFVTTHLAEALGIDRIVMWAVAPFVQFMNADLNSLGCRVLVVQGEKDSVVNTYATPKLTSEFQKRLPSSTTRTVTIKGGTHAGFASYTSAWTEAEQLSGFIIPSHLQHEQAVKWTVEFLRDDGAFKIDPSYNAK